MRDLHEYLSAFPILEHTTYLVSHSLGPMPRKTLDRLAEYGRMWAERGIRSWAEGWWEVPMRVGDQVGRIIGAPPGSTVMHQNVSIAEAVALSCFRPVDPNPEGAHEKQLFVHLGISHGRTSGQDRGPDLRWDPGCDHRSR